MKIADKTWIRNRACLCVCCLLLLFISSSAAQLAPGSMDLHWDQGAADCSKVSLPPLQVHPYNQQTYILRQNLCSTFEAPFLYLLIGSTKVLLIDTGDVADSQKMPLAKTVLELLPSSGSEKLPLLVVHSHRHLDHRAGDGQFQNLPNVQVVGYEVEKVKEFYKFTQWPNGLAQIDLGGRIVDVIPSPGHNETELSFYDRNTGLFFSGDFLIPGRLLIEDTGADLASAVKQEDLWLAALAQTKTAKPFLASPFSESNGMISPDGQWLCTNRTNRGSGKSM